MKEGVYEFVGFIYLIGILVFVLVLFFGGSIFGNVVSSDVVVKEGNISVASGISGLAVAGIDEGDVRIEVFGFPLLWVLVVLGIVLFVIVLIIIIIVVVRGKKQKSIVRGGGNVPTVVGVAPNILRNSVQPVASQVVQIAPQVVSAVSPVVPQTVSQTSPPVSPEISETLKYVKYYSQNVSHDPKIRIKYLIDNGKKFVETNNFVVAKEIYGFIGEEYKNLKNHDENIYSEIVNFRNSIK